MRPSAYQTELIVSTVRRHFGSGASVALFGSRLDDTARGGDVDLVADAPDKPTLQQRPLANTELEGVLQLRRWRFWRSSASKRREPSCRRFGRVPCRWRPQVLDGLVTIRVPAGFAARRGEVIVLSVADDQGTGGRPRKRRPAHGLAGAIVRDELIEPASSPDEWDALK